MERVKVEPPPAGYVKIFDPFSGYTRTVPEDQVYFPEAGEEVARRVEAWREFEQARDALLDSKSEGPSMVHFGTERGRWSSSGEVDRIKDSGERRSFGTGAVRDGSAETKGAPHLRPVHALNALDRQMQDGARKYESRNWEQGIPLSVYFDSAQRHADKLLAGYMDEDHEAAWIWNVACFIETRYRVKMGLLPAELDDMPGTFANFDPEF